MINSVKVTTYYGDVLEMVLREPENSAGFLVSDITGISPGDATINITENAASDGGVFNSARKPSRQITLYITFLGWPTELLTDQATIETVRQRSYQYFPLKREVSLLFRADNRVSGITGRVSKNEIGIFSERVKAQIVIDCPFPWFYDEGEFRSTTTYIWGVYPAFEFPFSNESLTNPLLIMGNIIRPQQVVIHYRGDEPVGITAVLEARGGTITNPVLHNITTRQSLKIDTTILKTLTGSGILEGDRIVISTILGNRHITLVRNGVYLNILNTLGKTPQWITLERGPNIFSIDADDGYERIRWAITHRTLYGGV